MPKQGDRAPWRHAHDYGDGPRTSCRSSTSTTARSSTSSPGPRRRRPPNLGGARTAATAALDGRDARRTDDQRPRASSSGGRSRPRSPGPRSKELHDRRILAVSAGLTVGLPVYIERAEGAILVDVDGNQLIDLGAGIAVTSVGHAVPEVVAAVARPGRALHPHLLHGHPLRGLRRGLRDAEPAHPRRPRQALGAVQLGRRGRGERRQDRAAARPAARPSSSSSTPTTAGRTSRWR